MRRTPASSLVCLRSLSVSLLPVVALPVVALPVLAALLLGTGCSKQAEGERCDINNGNLDCETGLVCAGEEEISITGRGVGLCCPITNPTVDACRADTSFPPEPDAGLPPAPPPPAPAPDAGGASTPDAGISPPPVTPDASAGDGGT